MSLNTEQDIARTWGSHAPLLQAVANTFLMNRVVECGCGKYSTPILRGVAKEMVSIEHDEAWSKKIQSVYEPSSKHKWIVEPLMGVNNGTPWEDLTPKGKAELINFYEAWGNLLRDGVDFLFVDTFRAARVPAVLGMAPCVDVIMLHDMEPLSIRWYGWEKAEKVLRGHGRCRYLFKPSAPPVNELHQVPWTGLYTRTEINFTTLGYLNRIIHPMAMELWGYEAPLKEWPW